MVLGWLVLSHAHLQQGCATAHLDSLHWLVLSFLYAFSVLWRILQIFYPIPPRTHFERFSREIFTQGEKCTTLVQLSISFLIGCLEKHNFYFLLFKQPISKLIDNCTSVSAISPCIKISLALEGKYKMQWQLTILNPEHLPTGHIYHFNTRQTRDKF